MQIFLYMFRKGGLRMVTKYFYSYSDLEMNVLVKYLFPFLCESKNHELGF